MIIVEHNPVYTVGIRNKDPIDYSSQEAFLRSVGAEFETADRGGLITFHGPGQMVCYPIINLRHFKEIQGTLGYVEKLQNVCQDICLEFGIKTHLSKENIGVWVGNNKICAIGVRCRDSVTTHGFSVNCDLDLKWFSNIVACGLKDKGVTSISNELNRVISVQTVVESMKKHFSNRFNCKLIE